LLKREKLEAGSELVCEGDEGELSCTRRVRERKKTHLLSLSGRTPRLTLSDEDERVRLQATRRTTASDERYGGGWEEEGRKNNLDKRKKTLHPHRALFLDTSAAPFHPPLDPCCCHLCQLLPPPSPPVAAFPSDVENAGAVSARRGCKPVVAAAGVGSGRVGYCD
jgi:hypothetical protein